MKLSELESRLERHAAVTKAAMSTAPFGIEREEIKMSKSTVNIKRIVLLAAVIACLVGTTGFAALHLLNANEAAGRLGNNKLAAALAKQGASYDTVTDGDYKATVLGITTGQNLSSFYDTWDVAAERTYAVVAVEKTDGSAMSFDDEILVTLLVSGLKPWQFNIFTMDGGYTGSIIDGVLYRIIEFDNIEYFADRTVYMAVLSESFIDNTAYAFDEATGAITPKEDYKGTNILIPLELDPKKADPEKAQACLKKLTNGDEETESTTTDGIVITDDDDTEEKSIIITDDPNGGFIITEETE